MTMTTPEDLARQEGKRELMKVAALMRGETSIMGRMQLERLEEDYEEILELAKMFEGLGMTAKDIEEMIERDYGDVEA